MAPEFKTLVTWMLTVATKTVVVVVADGRGDKKRTQISRALEESGVEFMLSTMEKSG